MAGMLGEGSSIAGRYRLVELIGVGGMGSVWRAQHLTLRSDVAIKLIDPAIASNAEIAARFMREAQSAAALRSTHVVQIFDYGIEGGVPYIAMELLQGESLRDRITRERRLQPRDIIRLVGQVARAVTKAHEKGIVHRDLKPENIFIVHEEDQEVVKVLDFGIAKISGSSSVGNTGSQTRTGAVLGTPYYMSPEQAQGTRTIDWRADLWALGVIVFECLTGLLPFQSEALGDLIIKICIHPLPVPSHMTAVPPGFDAWFLRALERDPERRFQSARELVESLKLVLGTTAGSSSEPPGAEPVLRGVGTGATAALTPAPAPTPTPYLGPPPPGTTQSTFGRTQQEPTTAPSRAALLVLLAAGALLFVGGGGALIAWRVGAARSAPDPSALSVEEPAPSASAVASAAPEAAPSSAPLAPSAAVAESPAPSASGQPDAPARIVLRTGPPAAPPKKAATQPTATKAEPGPTATKPPSTGGAFDDRKW
jgi:eukaryotic-like serine/threonine-protein kinase